MDTPATTAPDLGALIVRRQQRTDSPARAVLAGLGMLLGLGGVGMVFVEPLASGPLFVLMFVCLGLAAIPRVGTQQTELEVRERGVRVAGGSGAGELHYEELAAFAFETIRVYVNGSYAGTHHHLTLEGPPGRGGRRLHFFVASERPSDPDLEALRERLSALVAKRMLRELREAGSTGWVPGVTLTPDSLVFRRPGGESGRAALPGVRVSLLDGGSFAVTDPARGIPLFTGSHGEMNFFPGLLALEALRAEARA